MSFHVSQCATCGKYTEGAAYYASDAPRDPWGRVERVYADSKPSRYCSEECRDTNEQKEARA